MKNEAVRARAEGIVVGIRRTSWTEWAIVEFPRVSSRMTTEIRSSKIARVLGCDSSNNGDEFTAVINVRTHKGRELKPRKVEKPMYT